MALNLQLVFYKLNESEIGIDAGVGQGALGVEDSRGEGTALLLFCWKEELQKLDILQRKDDCCLQ